MPFIEEQTFIIYDAGVKRKVKQVTTTGNLWYQWEACPLFLQIK